MTYKHTLLSLTLLTVALIATGTSFLTLGPTATPNTHTAEPPDAYMENVVALILDKQGKPTMKIATPKLTHFKENDTTFLNEPMLTIYRQSPQPWYVTSHHATATNGIDAVQFSDDVTIHHAGDQHSPATLIATPTLIIYPEEQTAETADVVTFSQPGIIVKGIGMRANMKTGDIQVISQARGEYVPSA